MECKKCYIYKECKMYDQYNKFCNTTGGICGNNPCSFMGVAKR